MASGLDLEEFKYYYGDSRPYLHNYLISTGKVETNLILEKTDKKFPLTKVTKFTCNKDEKRLLQFPGVRTRKKIEDLIQNGTKPFVIIPLIIIKKYGCMSYEYSKHAILMLYNRNTHELERIDIKRYQLDGYTAKLLLKQLPMFVKWLQPFDPKIQLVEEIDTTKLFAQYPNFKEYYPMFIIAYLHQRLANPKTFRDNILSKLDNWTLEKFRIEWTKYVHFRQDIIDNCKIDSKEYHPEINRCVNKYSPSLNKILVDDVIKSCKDKLVYDTLRRKCVSPKNLAVIDLLQPKGVVIDKKESFIHLGKNATTMMAITYIVSKYPFARAILPTPGTKAKKNEWSIKWSWNIEKQEFIFETPENFWNKWNEFMKDKSVRFIIVYVALTSKPTDHQGHHANMLIYDKNNNEMERFDGLGSNIHKFYGINKFDKRVEEFFKENDKMKNMKYFVPLDYCPNMPVFQMKEINDIPGADLRGNCAVWALWYVNVRLANPKLTRKQVVLFAMRKLEKVESLYSFIKMYQKYLTEHIFKDGKSMKSSSKKVLE